MSDDDAIRPVTPAGSEARARLRAVHPTELRWTLELGVAPLMIGRLGSEGMLPLRHGTVSRRHFEVRWDEHARHHVGRDLGSHNGSRVNGQGGDTEEVALHDGAVLQLGDVTLVFERLPPDAPSLPPMLVQRSPLDAILEQPTRARGSSMRDGSIHLSPSQRSPIPGDAPAVAALRRAVEQAAPDGSPVLLWGEPDTDKEEVARELHRQSRRPGPLVTVDCSTVDPRRAEELLLGRGHGREPGLLASADGGTVFLDEICELPMPLQPKLLRALRDRELQRVGADGPVPVDVRVVAGSRGTLRERMEAGELRELYTWLGGWELHVPPLRERRGDLLAWIERLHTRWLEQRPDEPIRTLTLSPEAVEQVLLHPWSGNLRELERLVQELAAATDLPRPIPRTRLPGWLIGGDPETPTLPMVGPPVTVETAGVLEPSDEND